jgi:hypothetical protein
MPSTDPPASQSRRIIAGLIAALLAWGIYVAIGATGLFTDEGLFDARRSVIVLICSAAFLGSWLVILRFRGTASSESTINWSSIVSFCITLVGYGFWLSAHLVWRDGEGAQWTTRFGWTSLVCLGSSAVLALIGVSDPRPRRGKLLGLVTLVLLLLAVGLFVWQGGG